MNPSLLLPPPAPQPRQRVPLWERWLPDFDVPPQARPPRRTASDDDR